MRNEIKMALPGLRLKSTPEDVRSMPMAGAGLIEDGLAVADNGNGEQCCVNDGTKRPIGIVVHQNIGKNGKTAAGKEAYQQYDVVPVMTHGRIWVKPNDTITATGAKVYVRTSNPTTNAPIGSLQVAATDGDELVGATWDSLTNADGLAVVQLRGA